MIEVERMNADEMTKQVWGFVTLLGQSGNIQLKLVNYEVQTRESKRHKFKPDWRKSYDRYKSRSAEMKVEDVPFPADVVRQARDALIAKIEVSL